MNPLSQKLFESTASQVSGLDIQQYCPVSPRTADYVQAFTRIATEKQVPDGYSFDITETIGLTQWGDPSEEADEQAFRRFRLFTNAVGAAMCSGDKGPDDNLPPNYLAISLLEDACALEDESILQLLPGVFAEMHERVITARWCADDAPFLILGQLLLALHGYSTADPDALAIQMVEGERVCARRKGRETFLWGGTIFNQMHDLWQNAVSQGFADHLDDLSEPLRQLHEGLTGGADPRSHFTASQAATASAGTSS